MSLSVAMCTYNGAKYLEKQLASIARQELLPDELVISDDGSTDETLDIIDRFAKCAPFDVRVLRNSVNLGYSRNFQRAVGHCSGDFIALSDQDDVWYPPKLRRVAEVFRNNPSAEGVFSDGDLVDDTLRLTGRTLWESFLFGAEDQNRFKAEATVDALLRRNVVTGMAFVFRSSVKGLMESRPQSWIHDGWLAFLLALRSSLIALPERLVGYRIHGNQQVGAPVSLGSKLRWVKARGATAYLRYVRDKNLGEYRRTAIQFDDLAAYLSNQGEKEAIISKVRAKSAHAQRGVKVLSMGRASRCSIILAHLEDYARFSPNGLRAIPRDLLI